MLHYKQFLFIVWVLGILYEQSCLPEKRIIKDSVFAVVLFKYQHVFLFKAQKRKYFSVDEALYKCFSLESESAEVLALWNNSCNSYRCIW